MRKKYDNETLEKVFYYYSLAENRMLTAAQAADCLNLSESSLFRVIADFRESISKKEEEELVQKYQNIDIHSVLNIKENPKNYSTEKSILEDIAITLAEILASVNELKQYIIEKNSIEPQQEEESFLKEENDETKWEKLEELITTGEDDTNTEQSNTEETEPQKNILKEEEEPTVASLERELAKLQEEEEEVEKIEEVTNIDITLQKEKTIEEIENQEKNINEPNIKQKEVKKLDEISVMCVTQLNSMCKEISDLVPRENMEKMWNDWERICRGYGNKITSIYQRNWHQIIKKAKKIKITEDIIKTICEAQVEQMDLELKGVTSPEEIKNISYTYYNWVRQVFEMCYLVEEPMTQEKTKSLYTTYLTKLKNVSSYKTEQIKSAP